MEMKIYKHGAGHMAKMAATPIYGNQRTNGPVNAHLISWPRISICLAKVKGTSYTFIYSFS